MFQAVNLSICWQKRGKFRLTTNYHQYKAQQKWLKVGLKLKHFSIVGLMSPGWVRTQVRTHSDFCWTLGLGLWPTGLGLGLGLWSNGLGLWSNGLGLTPDGLGLWSNGLGLQKRCGWQPNNHFFRPKRPFRVITKRKLVSNGRLLHPPAYTL